jgi:hypothetical protein
VIIPCPHCGKSVVVNGLGRKPLNIPLKNVCERLRRHCSVGAAAEELGCSKAYIFKVLKANGLKLRDVVEGIGEGDGQFSGTLQIQNRGRYQTKEMSAKRKFVIGGKNGRTRLRRP